MDHIIKELNVNYHYSCSRRGHSNNETLKKLYKIVSKPLPQHPTEFQTGQHGGAASEQATLHGERVVAGDFLETPRNAVGYSGGVLAQTAVVGQSGSSLRGQGRGGSGPPRNTWRCGALRN